MNLSEAKKYYKNPRSLSKKQYSDLKNNLAELGDLSGIVHNELTNEIISGNQRSAILENAKIVIIKQYDEPTKTGTIAEGYAIWNGEKYNYRKVRWNEKQCEKANITANKLGGIWDYDVLANEFELDNLLEWGFEANELLGYFGNVKQGLTEDDEIPEIDEKNIVTKTGDLWLLGEHRLFCGDSTKHDDVEKLMDGQKADMIFTDPPYDLSENDTLKFIDIINNFANKNVFIMFTDGACAFMLRNTSWKLRSFHFAKVTFSIPAGNYFYRQHIPLMHFYFGKIDWINTKKGLTSVYDMKKYRGTSEDA